MEILKRPDERTLYFTCECGCVFRANRSEYDVEHRVVFGKNTGRDNEGRLIERDCVRMYDAVSMKCPSCGRVCEERYHFAEIL